MKVFDDYESEVRSYVRSFPTVFETGRGWHLYDREGVEYLDFFSGAGVLNYGHNDPAMKQALLDYVGRDGVAHSLDMATGSKERFLETFHDLILVPRGLGDYVVQFPGPTGTNAVEAALKLARKVTGRQGIVAFTNAFHGMTLGALAVTGSAFKRAGAGLPLAHGAAMPYEGFLGPEADTIAYIERYIGDQSSGLDLPAAIVVETVQAEGGVNVASFEWLRRLERVARRWEILLVVDDIQVGNGRTGPFLSFEAAGIRPGIFTLSKSLSGFGQPFSITVFDADLDVWEPGEHNGTFRGNNLAFVTSVTALEQFWKDDALSRHVDDLAVVAQRRLQEVALAHADLGVSVRGRGLIWGLAFDDPTAARDVVHAAFKRRLIVETSGPEGEVVKLLPPLVIDRAGLDEGLDRLADAVATVDRD